MLQFEYTPTNPTLYDRPRCPKCITQMYLAQIKPDQPGFRSPDLHMPKLRELGKRARQKREGRRQVRITGPVCADNFIRR